MIRSFTWIGDESLPTGKTGELVPDVPADGWIWLDLSAESAETIRDACQRFGVPQSFVDEALAEGSVPMLQEQGNLVYVVLNTFRSTSSGRVGASEVDFFVGPGFLLTIHPGDTVSTTVVQDRLEKGVGLKVATPAGLLAQLAMVGSRRIPALIDRLESQLDPLEELAMSADPRALTEAHALRRDVIVMRRILVPQRQIFEELAEPLGIPFINEPSRREFDRVADYQAQILESLETARSLLGSVLETHRAAVADQTNEIVRVLTVFSAILLPLTLISGIYGMNFHEIPLADDPVGFWVMVGVMAAVALTLWIYFVRRRFVGMARLSELPKAVGLGIYHAGAAPIRVVAGGIRQLGRTEDTDA